MSQPSATAKLEVEISYGQVYIYSVAPRPTIVGATTLCCERWTTHSDRAGSLASLPGWLIW